MVVAYRLSHNEGVEQGFVSLEDEATFAPIVFFDLYEVDGEIRAFKDADEAQAWLDKPSRARVES